MKQWGLIIGLWLALLVPAGAQDHPLKGVALVIGESKYEGLLPALSNPRNDARALDDRLSDLGFDVTRVLDGNKQKLDSEITDFIAAAKGADVALVYYSGHGIEAGGSDFLLPIDVDLATPQAAGASMIPVDALLDKLSRTVPVTIMLLDACRSNGLPAGTLIQPLGAGAPLVATDAGLAVVRGPSTVLASAPADQLGMVIGFAAAPGQSALDGDPDGNSPYAAALLKHLGAGGYSFGDLMTMVSEEVYLKTGARQSPWVNSSLRRVLIFGKPLAEADADQAAIAHGRQQLLLSIATAPAATRATVEQVAQAEGVPLDALYGVLEPSGGQGTDQDLRRTLEETAAQLQALKAQAPGTAKSDPELARLAALADEAQAEGVMGLALQYREQAGARADALVGQIDANEANLRADRLQLATTYAEEARQAMVSFRFDQAATRFNDAFTQAEHWDEQAALDYKTGQGTALASFGYYQGDEASQRQALEVYAEVLALAPRDKDPQRWAVVQNLIGNVHEQLAERSSATADLEAAVAAFRAAMEIKTRATDPVNWAVAEGNLGAALNRLSQVTYNVDMAREAVTTMSAALEVISKDTDAQFWATLHYNIGATQISIGQRTAVPDWIDRGIGSITRATEIWTKDSAPLEWGNCQYALGVGTMALASGDQAAGRYRAAIVLFARALQVRSYDRLPLDWAMTLLMTAQSYEKLGEITGDRGAFGLALGNMNGVFTTLTRDRDPLHWAMAQDQLGVILGETGRRDGDVATIGRSLDAFDAALSVLTEAALPYDWARTMSHLGWSRVGRAALARDLPEALKARGELAAAQARFTALGSPDASLAVRQTLVDRVVDILRQNQGH